MTEYKHGDRIRVKFPKRDGNEAYVREGRVKYHSLATGRVYWYCAGGQQPCGHCGPGVGEGAHRTGMFGSVIL